VTGRVATQASQIGVVILLSEIDADAGKSAWHAVLPKINRLWQIQNPFIFDLRRKLLSA